MRETNHFIERFAQTVFNHRWLIIAACVTVALACATGAPRLKPASDYRVFFIPSNPQLQAYEALRAHYTNDDNILLVIEPPGGDVFTPEYLGAVARATQRAWQLPYVIRVDSITNFQYSHADGDELIVEDLYDSADRSRDGNAVRQIALTEPQLLDKLISARGDITGINLSILLPGEDPMSETPAVVNGARALAAELRQRYPGMNTYLTGTIMLNNAFAEASMVDMTTLIPAFFALVLISLVLWLRSFAAVFTTLGVAILSIMTAMGTAGWLGYPMTPPMAIVPIIILTLAVANCVHLLLPALKGMRRGIARSDALLMSMQVNSTPILLTMLTTVLGFVSLNLTEVRPFHHLGNSASVGVAVAFVFTLTLAPALFLLLPMNIHGHQEERDQNRLMAAYAGFITRRYKPVLAVTGIVSALLLSFIPANVINENLIQYFDTSIAFRQDSDYVNDRLTGTGFVDYSLTTTENGVNEPQFLQQVEAFTQWLRQQPEVVNVYTITDTFKRLNKNMHGDETRWYTLPDQRDLAAQYLLLYEMSLPYGLDLNNQVNLDKSATRLSAIVGNMTAREYIAFDERATAWMQKNTPAMTTMGSSPTMMFSHISMNNATSILKSTTLALASISVILIIALRSLRIGLLSLVPNLLPIGIAFGLWGMLNGWVGLGLSLVAATSLGIIVDDTVHFLSKYMRGRRQDGLEPAAAIHYAFTRVGDALAITSFSLIVGFATLSFSVFKLNSDMGLLTATTLGLALLFDFLLLPALVLLFDRARPNG